MVHPGAKFLSSCEPARPEGRVPAPKHKGAAAQVDSPPTGTPVGKQEGRRSQASLTSSRKNSTGCQRRPLWVEVLPSGPSSAPGGSLPFPGRAAHVQPGSSVSLDSAHRTGSVIACPHLLLLLPLQSKLVVFLLIQYSHALCGSPVYSRSQVIRQKDAPQIFPSNSFPFPDG